MPVQHIASVDDPRVACYRDLTTSNLTRLSGKFIVEGRFLVEQLLASNFEVESLLVDERAAEEFAARATGDVPVFAAETDLLHQIAGFQFHRGVLACGTRKQPLALSDIFCRDDAALTAVACVDIQDQENLGGILRNCAAFGVDLVLVNRQTADPFSRRVLRVSMGAAFRLRIVESADLAADLAQLRQNWNVQLVATVLDTDAEPLESARRPERIAILVGNEAHGLSREWVELCDRRVTIPMQPETDSLNVAVASGIVLFQLAGKRT